MKTSKNSKQVSLAALKQQRSTLDKQNTVLFIGTGVMAIVMTAVLCLGLNQTVTDAIITVSVIAMEIVLPVSFYMIVKRTWVINDIEREMRKNAIAQENAA